MGGEPDYLHTKEAVIISPLYAASLTTASPLGPRLEYHPAAIPDMGGCSNIDNPCLPRCRGNGIKSGSFYSVLGFLGW